MDMSDIKKVVESTDTRDVNAYLATRRWTVLACAPGQMESGEAYYLYSLGWYGPYDPEFPEDDHSEFPDLPSRQPELPVWG